MDNKTMTTLSKTTIFLALTVFLVAAIKYAYDGGEITRPVRNLGILAVVLLIVGIVTAPPSGVELSK